MLNDIDHAPDLKKHIGSCPSFNASPLTWHASDLQKSAPARSLCMHRPYQACYFGHANCARILIMVGANVGAQDCYGNTPSQIFDDHVTEPVLDEVGFFFRYCLPCRRLPAHASPNQQINQSIKQSINRSVSARGGGEAVHIIRTSERK